MKQCKLKKFIKRTLCYRNKKMPNKVCSFKELVKCLRRMNKRKSTIVEYKQNINDVKKEAIRNLQLGGGNKCYGVYIIYCVCNTKGKCEDLVKRGYGKVLYIGMSGTIVSDAHHTDVYYQKQDVIERIGNTKNGDISSNEWFKNISQQYGRICIEIICIDVVNNNNRKPQCKLLTPAFIEKLLLSCYLCEKGELPLFNSKL